jgi:uncharacterized protein
MANGAARGRGDMSPTELALLSSLIFLAAGLYSSVGHAGASGYIAAMALFGLAPTVMKPTALALNILVASLATYRWNGAGLVNWRALLPLAVTSVPSAFIGGAIQLPSTWYRVLVGIVLLVAGIKLLHEPRTVGATTRTSSVPWRGGLVTGAVVGILSGLTGTGGGIFLSPLLLMLGWAGARQGAGITAPFILINSGAGLAGNFVAVRSLPPELPYFVIAAVLGALIGLQVGLKWASSVTLQRLLGLVLIIAAAKFLLA